MHCLALTVGKLAIKGLCIYHSRRGALALVNKLHLRARAAPLLTLRHGDQTLLVPLLLAKHNSSPLPALQHEQARPRAPARLGGRGRLLVQARRPLARGRPPAPVSLLIRALLAPAQQLARARLLAQARLPGRVRLLARDPLLSLVHLRGLPVAQHRRALRRVARLGRSPCLSAPSAA